MLITQLVGFGVSAGSAYATWNPLDKEAGVTLSNGELTATHTTASVEAVRATVGKSVGKWYWETTVTITTAALMTGIATAGASRTEFAGQNANGHGWYSATGNYYNSGSDSAYATSYVNGDVLGFALDMVNLAVYFRKNGTWQAGSDPVAGSGGKSVSATTYYPFVSGTGGIANTKAWVLNAGQSPFANAAPTGYFPLAA
jgi:hypothetical protein